MGRLSRAAKRAKREGPNWLVVMHDTFDWEDSEPIHLFGPCSLAEAERKLVEVKAEAKLTGDDKFAKYSIVMK